MLSVVVIQDDQIALGEAQERGIDSCYQKKTLLKRTQRFWF